MPALAKKQARKQATPKRPALPLLDTRPAVAAVQSTKDVATQH